MGQEIESAEFSHADFSRFREHVDAETALLSMWFQQRRFADAHPTAGFELEAWLIDAHGRPAPANDRYLERLGNGLVVPELAKFNVEVNGTPQPLKGGALAALHRELEATWVRCQAEAAPMSVQLLMIGILPTLRREDLTLANMSTLKRYRALNEQVLRLRQGRPLALDIQGRDHLRIEHHDVMLESAATSFQIHLQVSQDSAVRYYNAALLASAPMVAACANSPFLFGRDLWDETRIPLFEQSVEVGGFAGAVYGPTRRVTFGTDYARHSLSELFVENREHYPVLLPIEFDADPSTLSHLRLHNGTIWRWNRPLIGFSDGTPHLRIEHRVVPGGPSVIDEIANAALFFGLAQALATAPVAPELNLPFTSARDNFYAAARNGLRAQLNWLDGRRLSAQELLLKDLLPRAHEGLQSLGVDDRQREMYLGIVQERVAGARNGACWQRGFVERNGPDWNALTLAYQAQQRSGRPVHTWIL